MCPECGVDFELSLRAMYATSKLYWVGVFGLLIMIGAGATLAVENLRSPGGELLLGAGAMVVGGASLVAWAGQRGEFEKLPTYKRQERFALAFAIPLLLAAALIRALW